MNISFGINVPKICLLKKFPKSKVIQKKINVASEKSQDHELIDDCISTVCETILCVAKSTSSVKNISQKSMEVKNSMIKIALN